MTNECPYFNDSRNRALEKARKILGQKTLCNLEEVIMQTCFAPGTNWTKKQIRELIDMTKTFVADLYMTRKKKTEVEDTQVSDDEPRTNGAKDQRRANTP